MVELSATLAADRPEVQRFVELFGDQGAIWFADGLTIEQATEQRALEMQHRLVALENRAKAAAKITGETAPAGFCADNARPEQQSRRGFANKLRLPATEAI